MLWVLEREIAEKILKSNADYTLALKGNQKKLHLDVIEAFENVAMEKLEMKDIHATIDSGHGRCEFRQYILINDLGKIQEKHEWPGLASIGMVRTIRLDDNKVIDQRYYLNSFSGNVERFASAVRSHWSIESLHWQLDVSMFNEDQSRVRKDHAPENLAVLRRTAVNLLSNDTSKISKPKKMLRCMLDHKHIVKILTSK